jgi:hypothetical protein
MIFYHGVWEDWALGICPMVIKEPFSIFGMLKVW